MTKVKRATAVVVPDEFAWALLNVPAARREEKILEAVWGIASRYARELRVVWCVQQGVRRLPAIHAWRERRVREDHSFFLQDAFPADDFYPLVGAEVGLARRRSDLTIVFSHSRGLVPAIRSTRSGGSPVVLVGIRPGIYQRSCIGGEGKVVERYLPDHFRRRPRTVREVILLDPPS